MLVTQKRLGDGTARGGFPVIVTFICLFVHWFNCSSALQPVQITFCQLQGAGDSYDILPAPGTPDRQVIGNYQEEPAVRGAAGARREAAPLTAWGIRISFLKEPTGRKGKEELGWKTSPRHENQAW